jgi:hypothetical protein
LPASSVTRNNSSHFTRDDHVHKPFAPYCGYDLTTFFALAITAALENGGRGTFKTGKNYKLEFPIQPGVIPWLRACARRNGIPIEHTGP